MLTPHNASADVFPMGALLRVNVSMRDLSKVDQKTVFIDILQRMLAATDTALDENAGKLIDKALQEWK